MHAMLWWLECMAVHGHSCVIQLARWRMGRSQFDQWWTHSHTHNGNTLSSIKSKFSNVALSIQNEMKTVFPNFKVAVFYMVNAVALELQFACKIHCNFFKGSVQTLLAICICFLNCSFGILMSMSYSFMQSIFQVNLSSQCPKTACHKNVFGNMLNFDHTIPNVMQFWNSTHRLWRLGVSGDWQQFYKHPKFQFTHKIMMNATISWIKKKMLQCCITNAIWMAFPNFGTLAEYPNTEPQWLLACQPQRSNYLIVFLSFFSFYT